ncbi:MAG: glutamate--cysteine ligase [Candidatus Marinimicrobia bacterium]|nr:glutamate--cysteine ligase [Candidatus Neomarinimicrobiota bacterium]|tara:strand:- start:185 stop:1315 length:1131 start_codon:yes stop_codon:yes gene_type:complete
MTENRIFFNSSSLPTIGVELELQILDKDSYELVSGAPKILEDYNEDPRIKEELLDSIIEINTNICKNVKEVNSDLKETLSKVYKSADKYGFEILSMGTHPFSRWNEQSISSNPRYHNLIDRMQWPLRRLLITGVHVHIGVDSGEKAIAITNGLTRYIPHFIGLSANSPIHDGEITGLASTRTKIFESMPTAGLPESLRNYSEFQKFMRTLQKANTIESIREVWWDIRPHPMFGTVEIRLFDSVPSLKQISQLSAFTQCLVVAISNHYNMGTQLPLLDPWIIQENKWRATRYGLEADIIIDENGTQISLKSEIIATIERIMPIASKLECKEYLTSLLNQLNNEVPPYKKQLDLYNIDNDYKNVIHYFVKMFRESVFN